MEEKELKTVIESMVKEYLGNALDEVRVSVFCGIADVSIKWSDGPSIRRVICWSAEALPFISSIVCERTITAIDIELSEQEYARINRKFYWVDID